MASKRHLILQQIYEYRKGVRHLSLVTMSRAEAAETVPLLDRASIDHFVQTVNIDKVNLYFGHTIVVDTIRMIVTKPLNRLTPEEDFMLGVLLGYEKEAQCRRFLSRKRAGIAST